MALIPQIFGSVAMVLGVVVGETLALKVFGKVENTLLGLIDMIVFIVSLNWVFSQTKIISSLFPYLSYPLYFSFAFLIIFLIRGVTTLGGLKGKPSLEEKTDNAMDKVIGAMLKVGLSKKRIMGLLKKSGFREEGVDSKLSEIKEEDYIPVTLKRLDKIEKDLKELKQKIES